jgi:hypothetical protein
MSKQFRVVPCIGTKLYYKTQVKGFFGWKDETESNAFDDNVFGSIKSARAYLEKRYGVKIIIHTFECA